MIKKTTKMIEIGEVKVGGSAPVSVQSMTNTDTRDVAATVKQIRELETAGCEIIRVAVPDEHAAKRISEIKKQIKIPLIADIHFDYKLALIAIEQGVDSLRLNPGNIGSRERVEAVAKAALERSVPIRVGSNSGSISKKFLEKYKGPTVDALVESALEEVAILEKVGFDKIKISVKTSSVRDTIDVYRLISKKVDYPLHLGVTEAGTLFSGSLKSALGIGVLLEEGIGDTIRVSLTSNPIYEVKAGFEILFSLGLRERFGINLISCPTCGRTEFDVEGIASRLETRLMKFKRPITVAVMGCVVNGPGEAKEADIGVAGGKDRCVIFKKGEIFTKCKSDEVEKILIDEIESLNAKV